jgi:hypothetical protein
MRFSGWPLHISNLSYGEGELPDPWTAEHEANLPLLLQDWSKCDPPD